MTSIKKIVLSALALAALTGSAMAATPAPKPLSRAEMTSIRGEGNDATYIDYGALNKNKPICSKRGSSSSNCRPGAEANPYQRGCSKISHCSRQ